MSTTAIPALTSRISPKVLGKGVGIALLLYGFLVGFLWLKASDTQHRREEKLASETVIIDREAAAPEVAIPSVESYGPEAPAVEAPPEMAVKPEESIIAPATEQSPAAVTLESAPVEGFYEDTTEGRLPKIAENGLTPFETYKRPFTSLAGSKIISIALIDAGISETATTEALSEMPADVSVVITPYAVRADFWLEEARSKGFETWLTLPVETDLYPFNDPGPQTLLINAAQKLNMNKLHWTLSRGSGYAGLVTGAGASFLRSPDDARPIMNEIFTRGLGFVDGDTSPSDIPATLAESLNGAYETVDVWIDVPSSPEHIAASFRQLEVMADGKGRSIGFVHVTPQSMKPLRAWLETLPEKGYMLAPLSAQASAAAQ